jgi:flagellar biogenesis protein FliO
VIAVLIAVTVAAAEAPPVEPETAAPKTANQTEPVTMADAETAPGGRTPSALSPFPARSGSLPEKAPRESNRWLWRYLFSLLVVGSLMVVVFVMLRKMRTLLTGAKGNDALRIVSRLPLDRHSTVYSLHTSHEIILLASGAHGVQVLSRRPLEDSHNPAADADETPPDSPTAVQQRAPFAQTLKSLLTQAE